MQLIRPETALIIPIVTVPSNRPYPPPTLEDLHRNIDLSNQYRMEFIKQGMLLAGAVFVFTVSFIKDLLDCSPVQNKFLVAMSWGAMAVSLLGGLGHLAGWDRFYIRYRDDFHALNEFDSTLSLTLDATTKETLRRITQQKIDKIKQLRTRITLARRTAMAAQLLGFAVGIITIAIFYYQNLR